MRTSEVQKTVVARLVAALKEVCSDKNIPHYRGFRTASDGDDDDDNEEAIWRSLNALFVVVVKFNQE